MTEEVDPSGRALPEEFGESAKKSAASVALARLKAEHRIWQAERSHGGGAGVETPDPLTGVWEQLNSEETVERYSDNVYRWPLHVNAEERDALLALAQTKPAPEPDPEPWQTIAEMIFAASEGCWFPTQDELRALADPLRSAPEPAPFCQRHSMEQTRNPHPKAGDPSLEFGYLWQCIPCLVMSRAGWSKRCLEAESKLAALYASPIPPKGADT